MRAGRGAGAFVKSTGLRTRLIVLGQNRFNLNIRHHLPFPVSDPITMLIASIKNKSGAQLWDCKRQVLLVEEWKVRPNR